MQPMSLALSAKVGIPSVGCAKERVKSRGLRHPISPVARLIPTRGGHAGASRTTCIPKTTSTARFAVSHTKKEATRFLLKLCSSWPHFAQELAISPCRSSQKKSWCEEAAMDSVLSFPTHSQGGRADRKACVRQKFQTTCTTFRGALAVLQAS